MSLFFELALEYFKRHPASTGILIFAALFFFVLLPKLPGIVSRSLLGELADEWPGIDRLLMPVLARAGMVTCEALVNHVLVDRPSAATRALLSAYGIRAAKLKLEMTEFMHEDGPPITEDALKIAVLTCVHARESRPSVQKIDPSALLAFMFSVPHLDQALQLLGLTKLRVTYYLSHQRKLPEVEEISPVDVGAERVWVRIHNDRYSTEDLVNRVLSEAFDKDREAALAITNDVQRFGHAHVGPYVGADALQRAQYAIARARGAREPLLLSLTTQPPSENSAPGSSSSKDRNLYAAPQSFH